MSDDVKEVSLQEAEQDLTRFVSAFRSAGAVLSAISALRKAQAEAGNLQEKIDKLSRDLAAKQAELAKAESDIVNTNKRAADAQRRLDKVRADIDSLKV